MRSGSPAQCRSMHLDGQPGGAAGHGRGIGGLGCRGGRGGLWGLGAKRWFVCDGWLDGRFRGDCWFVGLLGCLRFLRFRFGCLGFLGSRLVVGVHVAEGDDQSRTVGGLGPTMRDRCIATGNGASGVEPVGLQGGVARLPAVGPNDLFLHHGHGRIRLVASVRQARAHRPRARADDDRAQASGSTVSIARTHAAPPWPRLERRRSRRRARWRMPRMPADQDPTPRLLR